MTIKLLTQDEYDTLLSIQQTHPKLTFQTVGYQYIDRSAFTEDDKAADTRVITILKNHIEGFTQFNNFLLNSKGELTARIQYHYSPSFTGVGYVTLRELLNGFDTDEESSK